MSKRELPSNLSGFGEVGKPKSQDFQVTEVILDGKGEGQLKSTAFTSHGSVITIGGEVTPDQITLTDLDFQSTGPMPKGPIL